MHLREAHLEEAKDILDFYKNVINSIKDSEFQPRWNDSYPDLDFIQTSI